MNHTYLQVSGLLLFALFIQQTAAIAAREQVSTAVHQPASSPADSAKKTPLKRRVTPAQPPKKTTETQYSAPGHYTVTVPRENSPGGKADLILVNGTKPVDRIGDVDSNTIESIELLKDSRSIAKYKGLYGEKAAKGIVIIHLKNAHSL